MRSICSLFGLGRRGPAIRWAAACSRSLTVRPGPADGVQEHTTESEGEGAISEFDAAVAGAPVAVHQLIGDPRTGVADDTTTTPWGDDVTVEWVWSSPDTGVDWFRYSLAGPGQLPFMHMDSRLSDHSKNLMYLLRCKDPARWSIAALADKFRVRRQRVMAILALKEMQAHAIDQGRSMAGPLAPYAFRVPLSDFLLQPDGEPLDLAALVAQQQQGQGQQQRQQQDTAAAQDAAAAAAAGLGSLEDFLADDSSAAAAGAAGGSDAGHDAAAAAREPDALARLSAAAGQQQADLALLLPQLALTSQQLQLQLLQLLQQHHYSVPELQQRLLQQVDAAEAYFNTHIAGTDLEQKLLGGVAAAAAAPSNTTDADAADPAAAAEPGESTEQQVAPRPAWLDFDRQRQAVAQLISQLAPLLESAGPERDREAGRLLVALRGALLAASQPAAPAAADDSGAADAGAAAPAAALTELVQAASARPAIFARAFNQLDLPRRQQLLELVPQARVALNISGTDLHAAVSSSAAAAEREPAAGGAGAGAAAAAWPGQVPPLVDVWAYEELPRKLLAALQEQLGSFDGLLQQLDAEQPGANGSDSSSKAVVGVADLQALQQAAQVYAVLLADYDQVLAEQAAKAAEAVGAPPPLLPPGSQRRLVRILRELDPAAIEKLLLWESFFKEAASETRSPRGEGRRPQLDRLQHRLRLAIQRLDQQSGAAADDDYPDLPADVPAAARVSQDLAAAFLDSEVVGRHFHRGSGDRHFVRVDSAPAFEGYSLEDFDSIAEGELSMVSRLAAEREDNMMWKEFRERLLLNVGLLAPDLHQHISKARPPKPNDGWSFVVHPMGGAARSLTRQELRRQAREQWLDDSQLPDGGAGSPGDCSVPMGFDPATAAAPARPYVAAPSRDFRGLNEEEAVLAGFRRAKPRRRWYASSRSRPR